MDYLQYTSPSFSFITLPVAVLNLIINGLPSIHTLGMNLETYVEKKGFKPYYKWITFNTI